jgi:hypothetical protein
MEQSPSRTAGWLAFSAAVLILGGIAGIIYGLMAVYTSSFFFANAVFWFSGLETWGWITLGLGVAAVVSGLGVVATRREWARWTGVVVAGLAFLGQMLTAQAYPLWSLVLMGMWGLAVYGLIARGDWAQAASAVEEPRAIGATGSSRPSDRSSQRRAAPPRGTLASRAVGPLRLRGRTPQGPRPRPVHARVAQDRDAGHRLSGSAVVLP